MSEEDTNEHPALFWLEAVAAGDANAEVWTHLETCERCRAYVETSKEQVGAFDKGAFMAKLHDRRPRHVRLVKLAWVGAPVLAAAAALLLFVRPPEPVAKNDPTIAQPAMRFKGRVQLAVIRERDGNQERTTSEVTVKPGDRIRVEVGIDDARPILAGFLGKDGTWLVLVTPTVLEAGTYLSEKSARFDASPTEGLVIVGHPDDVGRARMTGVFDSVTVIPVVLER